MSSSLAGGSVQATHLPAGKQVRSHLGRSQDNEDFRVGSYVVHTPPMKTPHSSYESSTRSHIPGPYQFKTKLTTLNLQPSPPLSPTNRNRPKPSTTSGSLTRQNQQLDSPQAPNDRPPKAIPRSVVVSTRQSIQNSPIKSRLPIVTNQDYGRMGDRLSSIALDRPAYYNEFLSSDDRVQSSGTRNLMYKENEWTRSSVGGDSWLSQITSSPRYHGNQSTTTIDNTRRQTSRENVDGIKLVPRLPRGVSKIPHQVIHNELTGNRVKTSQNANLTNNNNNNNNNFNNDKDERQQIVHNYFQQHESSTDAHLGNNDAKYLTFNKNQATSHIKSLREEFSSHIDKSKSGSRDDIHVETSITYTAEHKEAIYTSPITPRPACRQTRPSPIIGSVGNYDDRHLAESHQPSQLCSSTSASSRQQPICEAFIMTGQSMLKLSCDESESEVLSRSSRYGPAIIVKRDGKLLHQVSNDSGKSHVCHNSNSSNCITREETKTKSLSLNRLNGGTQRSVEGIPSRARLEERPESSNGFFSRDESVSSNLVSTTSGGEVSATTPPIQTADSSRSMETSMDNSTKTIESLNGVTQSSARGHHQVERRDNSSTGSLAGIDDKSNTASGACRQTAIEIHPTKAMVTASNTTNTPTATITTTEADAKQKHIELNVGDCRTSGTQEGEAKTFYDSSFRSIDLPLSGNNISTRNIQDSAEKNGRKSDISTIEVVRCPSKSDNILVQQLSTPQKADHTSSAHMIHEGIPSNNGFREAAATSKLPNEGLQIDISEKEKMIKDVDSTTSSHTRSESKAPPSPNCNDRESARRLAKRLYNLSGFKRTDVCHNLAKNNPFSQMVAEEYLNLFDFRSMKLDSALRKFLSKFQLNGETQERERMLNRFSHRYYDCNKEKFPNSDVVQTLVCAMILLNTDLHGGHNKKKKPKLSLGAFIDGLNSSVATIGSNGTISATTANGIHGSSEPYTFPRHLLIDLYESVRKRSLKCGEDICDMTSFEAELDKIYKQQVGSNRSNTLPTRRFATGSSSSTLSASSRRHFRQSLGRLNGNQEDPESAIEFKSGYLNRKRTLESRAIPTMKGRRGWRRMHVTLRDARMIMRPGIYDESKEQKEQATAKGRAQIIAQELKNTLADEAEFLLQANNEQDMNSWVDTINFASACLSSPALPSAITNSKNRPQRSRKPVLPNSYTKLSYWEQLINHEERLQRLKLELDEHLSEAPNAKDANKRLKTEFIERIAYLKQEIERYTVYVDLMRKKSNSPEAIILSKHPQIASLVPSDEIVESPPDAPPTSKTQSLSGSDSSIQESPK